MPGAQRFIADVMLGGLAKWLRAMGFDTLYFRDIEDRELVRVARLEQRILLTRDRALLRERRVEGALLVRENETMAQLREVLGSIPLPPPGPPRCMRCNGELREAARESVMGEVPEHVFLNLGAFSRCSGCGRVYWEGSHKRMMDRVIRDMVRETGGRWKSSGND